MSSVVISGDTSGAITLAAPAIAGTNTLSLPAVTDTLVGLAATQTLTNKSIAATQLTGTIAAARLPSGSVLQVVSAIKTNTFSTNSTSYQTVTGLAATITPSSASSKILVMMGISGAATGSGSWHGQVQRNGTPIAVGDAEGSRRQDSFGSCDTNGGDATLGSPFIFLDSPATTSAVTYQVLINAGDGSGTMYINRPDSDGNNNNGTRTSSTVVLMEIAA